MGKVWCKGSVVHPAVTRGVESMCESERRESSERRRRSTYELKL